MQYIFDLISYNLSNLELPKRTLQLIDREKKPIKIQGYDTETKLYNPQDVVLKNRTFYYKTNTKLELQDVNYINNRAEMFLLTSEDKQIKFVVKLFDINNEQTLNDFNDEKKAFKLLKNDICNLIKAKIIELKEEKKAYVIMPKLDGDLSTFYYKKYNNGKYSLDYSVIANITKTLAEMLHCLWERSNLVYTDIKPENIAYRFLGLNTNNSMPMFEICIIDVGDMFYLKQNGKEKNWIATYPYYEIESKQVFKEIYEQRLIKQKDEGQETDEQYRNIKKRLTNFHRRKSIINNKNAELHMVWGIAVTALILVKEEYHKYFNYDRWVTNYEFKQNRKNIIEEIKQLDKTYFQNNHIWKNIFKAIENPNSVSLSDFFLQTETNTPNKKKRKRINATTEQRINNTLKQQLKF